MSEEPYPEGAKMLAVRKESQAIGAFLDSSEYSLCVYSETQNVYLPTHKSIEVILADYFAIDLDKVEEERQQILATIRSET